MKRTRVLAAKTALVTGAVALGLSGCGLTSPAVIKTPYPASDGIDADLPGTEVVLRNLIVVGAEKGAEAELIGSVINQGDTDARISLQAAVGETGQPSQTAVSVAAGQVVQFGPGSNQTEVAISDLAVDPGDVTGLTASTTKGGRVDLNVPVLPPEGDYAEVTPLEMPSDTASPEATGSPSATGDAAADEESASTGDSTDEPTTEATGKKNKQTTEATETSDSAS
ncbi:hypothetical protein KIH74_01945 [Kineosporia sp. J2-2]|uniref:Lipoprotein n=1 Tax=Kineosporia corallincola TaxID=2835133 RepID=A0ABS5TC23_9ACTN|nr:hypothetical protein [Kineosporia corallincola]MBT0767668.1 hypothetical protein [Kineosporia corallincola]